MSPPRSKPSASHSAAPHSAASHAAGQAAGSADPGAVPDALSRRPRPTLRVIAGALWASPVAPADPLAPARSSLTGASSPAAPAEPALTLPPELTAWLGSWEPVPLRHYAPDGPIITELAHDHWLRDWFDESGDQGKRSPGWLAATRLLAARPGDYDAAVLWLAEPAHLHLATDHLILIHGAGETLSEPDGEALLAAAGPMFDDARIGHRAADARHWAVWPQPPSPSAALPLTSAAPTTASAATALPTHSVSVSPIPAGPPKGRISARVVGRAVERRVSPDGTASAASAAAAHGHSVEEYLPRGPAGRTLRQLFNGVQMAWHEHAVNLQRSRDGLPAINSLWFTGPTSASDIERWRARALATGLAVDEGPLLARLNGDEAGWALELTEALLRAAADPSITTLVLCGERAALELRRKGAPPSVSSAASGLEAGSGSESDAGFDSGSAPTSSGLFSALKTLGLRLGRDLGRALRQRPTTQPLSNRHPSHWFREPGDLT